MLLRHVGKSVRKRYTEFVSLLAFRLGLPISLHSFCRGSDTVLKPPFVRTAVTLCSHPTRRGPGIRDGAQLAAHNGTPISREWSTALHECDSA